MEQTKDKKGHGKLALGVVAGAAVVAGGVAAAAILGSDKNKRMVKKGVNSLTKRGKAAAGRAVGAAKRAAVKELDAPSKK